MSPTSPTTPHTAIPIVTSKVYLTEPIYSSNGSIQYRVEERRRTIIIASQDPPDSQTMTELFSLPEHQVAISNDFDDVNDRRRTRSLEERALHISDHLTPEQDAKERRKLKRRSIHQKRSSISSRHSYATSSPLNSPATFSNLGQPWTMIQQPPILFYHKHEPHYGFTNFSPHEVVYKGKVYPTSEHLFQSFKVGTTPLSRTPLLIHTLNSFKVYVLVWPSTSEHVPIGLVWLFPKLVGFNQRFEVIGSQSTLRRLVEFAYEVVTPMLIGPLRWTKPCTSSLLRTWTFTKSSWPPETRNLSR